MGRWPAFALVPLAVASLTFQTVPGERPVPKPAPTARPTPAPKPVLEGTVKGPDGKPLDQALVLVRPSRSQVSEATLHARTDAAGHFRIELASAGPQEVRVESKGLAARRLEKVPPGTPLAIALTRGATLEGTVRDSQGGAPVAGARVTARDHSALFALGVAEPGIGVVEATAGAKGQFRLEGLAPGLQTVTARARGHGFARRNDVRAGTRLDLTLVPGATLFGRVTGPEGQPVARALVSVQADAPSMALENAPEATDSSGQFEIMGLAAGTYALTVRHKDYAPAAAVGLSVESEGQTRSDITLGAGSRVTGRLLSPDSKPLGGRVNLRELDGRPAPWAMAGLVSGVARADGRFELRLGPAAYALEAVARGYGPQRVEVTVAPRGTGPVDLGDIVLESGLTIRGHVRDKARTPLPGVSVQAWPNPPQFSTRQPVVSETEADGAFVLAGLSEGSWRVSARAPGFAEASRLADTGADRVDFVLGPGGGLTGVAVDDADRPVDGGRVLAEPASRSGLAGPFGTGFARVESDGRFAVQDLAQGEYTLRVEAPELAPGTADVKVVAGATTDVGRIRLSRGGTVRGTVVDAAGSPVAGANVLVRSGNGRSIGNIPSTDAAGAFEARGVSAGEAEVVARHPRFATGRLATIVDPAKGATEARIVLTEGGRIEGWARARDGSPLLGQVRLSPASETFRNAVQPDGSFVFEHVATGRVRVMLMPGAAPDAQMIVGSLSREVDVREGETTTLELRSREILVTGHVTRRGAPLRARVGVFHRGPGGYMMIPTTPGVAAAGPPRLKAETGDDGRYELVVEEPGESMLSVDSLDGQTTLLNRTVTIPDVEAHVLDVALAEIAVKGVVVDRRTREPVAQARIAAYRARASQGGFFGAKVGPDGRFTLELEPGDYRLRVYAEDYAEASRELAVTEAGAPDIHLELDKGLTLEGRVVDPEGRPASGVRVGAAVAVGAGRLPSETMTGTGDGTFRFQGLSDEPHTLLAVTTHGSAFAFQPGVSPRMKDLVLRLQPGGKARVEVVTPEGTPAEGAHVYIAKVEGLRVSSQFFGPSTDARGVTEVSVPAGSVELSAVLDQRFGQAQVTVSAGAVVPARIQLADRKPRRTP